MTIISQGFRSSFVATGGYVFLPVLIREGSPSPGYAMQTFNTARSGSALSTSVAIPGSAISVPAALPGTAMIV